MGQTLDRLETPPTHLRVRSARENEPEDALGGNVCLRALLVLDGSDNDVYAGLLQPSDVFFGRPVVEDDCVEVRERR
jgi:hypothetical protein